MVLNLSQIEPILSRLLDRGYEEATASVLKAVADSTNAKNSLIQRRLRELDAEVTRLKEDDQRLDPRNPVLRALLADLDDVMRGNARRLADVSPTLQRRGIEAAGTITRQLALPFSDNQLKILGVTWNAPPPEAVERLIDFVESEAWDSELGKFPGLMTDTVSNQAIRGFVQGWSPLRIAEEIRRITEHFPYSKGNTLMRTLHLQSYRSGTAIHQNANIGIIDQVIRVAALDDRICLACIDLHGHILWDSERNAGQPIGRVNDHHNGRCTSITVVKGMERVIPRGANWFDSLDEGRQRLIAGPGKLELLKTGKATLHDFTKTYDDPVFGTMVRENSMIGAGF